MSRDESGLEIKVDPDSRQRSRPWHVLLVPFAASAYIYALLRSMIVTLHQGGVTCRGTFYPLAKLRTNAAPFLEPL